MDQGDISYENTIDFKDEDIIFKQEIEHIKSQKGLNFKQHARKLKRPMFYFRQESEPIEIKGDIFSDVTIRRFQLKS